MLARFPRPSGTRPVIGPRPPGPPSPVEISEILTLTFAFLDQPTLVLVVGRVCRQWRQVAQLFFTRHLQIDSYGLIAKKNFHKRLLRATQLTVGLPIPWRPSSDVNKNRDHPMWWRETLPMVLNALKGSRLPCKTTMDPRLLMQPPMTHLLLFLTRVDSTLRHLDMQELSLDIPLGMKDVFLDLILQQCPNLVSLSISALRWIVPSGSTRPLVSKSSSISHRTLPALPLRSLQLYSLSASPGVLVSYLPRFGNLRKLSLLDIWDADDSVSTPATANKWEDSHFDKDACRQLWVNVARFCPHLLSIRYCINYVIRCPVPLELFPQVEAWGIDNFLVAPESRTWADLTARSMENRLTTLEILKSRPGDANWMPTAEQWRDDLVYRFLRSSPHLVHFKAGGVNLSNVALWGVSLGLRDTWLSETWACRGLKTLSLSLVQTGNQFPYDTDVDNRASDTRRAFSYITRVCPQLQGLSIKIGCPLFKLENGLCLLTRLSDLRRLTLSAEFYGNEYTLQEQCQRNDFAWIRGIEGSSESTATSKALPHQLSSTFSASSTFPTLTGFVRRMGREALSRTLAAPEKEVPSVQDDLKVCLKRVKDLSELGPWDDALIRGNLSLEDHRAIIRQQQDRNCYRTDTDYGLEPPFAICMVDGLEKMDYSGTSLELEAYFQARLFAMSDEGRAQGQTHQLPWPKLKQLVFYNARLIGKNKTATKEQADFVQQLFRELRPDIDTSCLCSDKAHFMLDM